MINYTEHLALLMQDVVSKVPTLSFIDMADVLVFARPGRTSAEGAFATCHCLSLPPSEPGYYFWRDRDTSRITRRSQWFVTKSPTVTVGTRQVKYMLSFTIPRFPDQSLNRSRKEKWYPRLKGPWVAKLDTVIHELYHIDPDHNGIRRIDRGDGIHSAHCHNNAFFARVAAMVAEYLDARPDRDAYDFLSYDFAELEARYGGVVGTSFRTFPSYPQRFLEPLAVQPVCEADVPGVEIEAIRSGRQPVRYTEDDLHVRHFSKDASRRLVRKGRFRAA
jgi:hypothetical protein